MSEIFEPEYAGAYDNLYKNKDYVEECCSRNDSAWFPVSHL
jgi:hypothetical protein